jgi:hypothetical protein
MGFWGEVDFENKSGKGITHSGTSFSCSEFHGDFNGEKTGFLSPTAREIYSGNKTGKIEKLQIRPPPPILHIVPRSKVPQVSLFWNPKGFFFV